MKKEELDFILQEGEGYKIEFKENLSNLDKEITAFANSSGGKIFLGVTDKGEIKGIEITNKLKSQIQDIANNCEPKINLLFDTFDNILMINVLEGKDKPYRCSHGFYKRIGPNSQKLLRDEIIDLFKSEGKIRFDELIELKFVYPDDFDNNKFSRFLEMAEISLSSDIEKQLVNLGVAENQGGKILFNNAGVLFCAKEPQHFFPWSVYTVALFKNKEGSEVIDRKEIKGSLFEIVEDVMKFIRYYSKVAYKFSGGGPQRANIYEYPFDAIREAVINSVMHKYYFEHGHNNIIRFLPDKIRIENYWQKPKNFVLGETVFRRNQIIADLFARIHFGEKIGTGFERIKEMCKKENSPFPDIEFNESYFYVIFKQKTEYLEISKNNSTPQISPQISPQIPTKLEQKILTSIKQNPNMSRVDIAKMLNLSEDTIKEYIERLKQKNLLKRVGPDRGGHWEIVDRVNNKEDNKKEKR